MNQQIHQKTMTTGNGSATQGKQHTALKHAAALLLAAGLLLAGTPAHAGKVTRYVHTDHLGNPVAKTDSTGAVIWRQSYTPDGEAYQQPDPDGPGFTGHRNDAATGLVYMQARYYDPVIGRFLSVDPVTFSPDKPEYFNRYWYAGGNPMNNTDPDGRCYAPPVAAGCAVVGGIAIVTIGIVKYYTDPVARDGIDGLVEKINEAASEVGQVVFNENANNDGATNNADPLDGVLEDAKPGRETKGRTTNWDKEGGIDQANEDFDDLVPGGGESIEGKDGARKGTDELGRKVNVRPSSTDGRPTLEVQDGKDRTKIRYDD